MPPATDSTNHQAPWRFACSPWFEECVVVISGAVVLMLSFVALCYLVMPTTIPRYPDFQIKSLSASDFSLHNYENPNQLSGNWSIDFNVRNFNIVRKMMIFYFSDIDLSILYGKKCLWITSLGDFDLGPKNVSATFGAKLWGSSGSVHDSISEGIRADIKTNGTVKFDVKFVAAIENYWFNWAKSVVANCNDIELSFMSPNNNSSSTNGMMMMMSNGLKACEVKFTKSHKWVQSNYNHGYSSNISHANM